MDLPSRRVIICFQIITSRLVAVGGLKRGCPVDHGVRVLFRLLVFVDRDGNLAQEGQLHGHRVAGGIARLSRAAAIRSAVVQRVKRRQQRNRLREGSRSAHTTPRFAFTMNQAT